MTATEELATPQLIDLASIARLTSTSLRHCWTMLAAGKMPASVRFGKRRLWRRADVLLWIEWGCPPREEFERRLEARKSAGR